MQLSNTHPNVAKYMRGEGGKLNVNSMFKKKHINILFVPYGFITG